MVSASFHRDDPYVFQLGFDFGTSYSKCVIRDLQRDNAFVFTFDLNGEKEFLLSSSIVYQNTIFRTNTKNEQYPDHGLWHIKMALADLARNKRSSSTLSLFSKAANLQPESPDLDIFVQSSCLFYLSRALWRIRQYLLKRFPDFGKHDSDDMYVTMAIPVSDIEDKDTEKIFLDLLKKAWCIANRDGSLPENESFENMKNCLRNTNPDEDNDKCHVYPEVSANIQTFINSPVFPGKSTRIYLVSDIGAGTVDQCCFTFYSPTNQGTLNYFSAQVFELGSGIIERKCFMKHGGTVEEWRKVKESSVDNNKLPIKMLKILKEINDEFSKKTAETLKELREHLYDDNGVNPENSIQEHLHIIFSGGGDMENPYHTGLIQALVENIGSPKKSGASPDWKSDRIIPINDIPEDIELEQESWMKRLYVAYGLSFGYEDLTKIKLPNQTRIRKIINSQTLCPYCQGTNSQCVHCNGFGYIFP